MESGRIRLMLRALCVAIALLIPGFVQAESGPAEKTGNSQLCSDSAKGFSPCGISKADKKKVRILYRQAASLVEQKKFDEALDKMKEIRGISPRDTVYVTAERAIQEKLVADDLRKGNKAVLAGDAENALGSFRRAVELDPTNDYAQERLRDALPVPSALSNTKLRADLAETRLEPLAVRKSFEFKGSSSDALEQFAKLFGIATTQDQGLTSRKVRIKLDDVDWETGSQILQKVSKVLIVPLTDHSALLANDTEENRRDLTRMSLRTFYAQGGSTPQDLTDLTTALRVLFELRFISPNVAQGGIVIRAPQQTMDAITKFLDYVQGDQPSVIMEVKVFQISTTFTRDLGASVPNEFTVFNVGTELQNLVSSSSYQQIVAALQASGQTVNATTILAALLASAASSSSSTSSLLTQPFATFGGGLTLSGVTIPSTTVQFSDQNSLARTLEDVLLRAGQGKAATMKVGERYPIVSSLFSAASATSSLLSSLGISSSAAAAAVPTPQFSFEDLGLVMKATPRVHGKLVSLEYEMTLRALGATQSNGLPLLTNREIKGTISTDDGQSVVMAGMVEKAEIASINGIPLLSMIPVVGEAFSVNTKEHTRDELLVVVTPHIVSAKDQTGAYIRVPMNGPK